MTAFTHAHRRRRTPREFAQIFEANGGRCHLCTRKLGPRDRWELDHKIALAAGGTDDDDNLAPACDWCHEIKTKGDVGVAAKIKRLAIRHTVPAEHRRSRSWRR
jgi:5-methylcytosine-specific restriction endonuclease McrA